MTEKQMVNTIDFRENGQIDLESIHPSKLSFLIEAGYVQEINPGDGEKSFFILSEEGRTLLNG